MVEQTIIQVLLKVLLIQCQSNNLQPKTIEGIFNNIVEHHYRI